MERDLTQALYGAAVALGHTRDAEEVVRVAIAETQRASGVEAVALYLLDPKRDALILREFAGTTSDFREGMGTLPLSDAQVAAGVIKDQRIATIAVEDDPTPSLRALFAEHGFRHVTAASVAGREQILGMLFLASREEVPLGEQEEVLIQAIAGLVGVALENVALRESLLAQQGRLRALAAGVLQAREEEARRIAHELHDEVGQLLAALHITLDNIVEKAPEHSETFRGLHDLLDRVEGELRRLSRELRPTILDDLGLASALEWLVQGMAERAGLAISMDVDVGRLSSSVETALYRIVQEALTNVIRHARAKGVKVEVRNEGLAVRAVVRDDGQGFDLEATLARRGERGLGLIGIRERVEGLGGELKIVSAPGKGTELSATIPTE